MQNYKVNFGLLFIICLIIMVLNEVWVIFNNMPEIFMYGDIIYHFIASSLSIVNNIAIGITSAIIFYYVVEFLNKKKDYEIYSDVRANIYFMFYEHLEVLTKLNHFNGISKKKKNRPNMFNIYDIPLLISLFEEISTDKQIEIIKKELVDFFRTQSNEQIELFAEGFTKYIERIQNMSDYRYFKDSKELIETICIIYNDDFYTIVGLIFNSNENNRSDYLEVLANDYFSFLKATIDFYIELDKFIDSINNKKVKTFITMLD